MSVRRAQAEIDSAEYAEWLAFHSTEPFAHDRSENMLCVIASILVNINRPKGARAVKPNEFKLEYGKAQRDDAKTLEMKLRAIFPHGDN